MADLRGLARIRTISADLPVHALFRAMECFACDKFLGDLPFELDAVRAVLGHGFHPLKARQAGSNPNLQSVHRQGRTQALDVYRGQVCPTRQAGD
jgi:hypothetical protein